MFITDASGNSVIQGAMNIYKLTVWLCPWLNQHFIVTTHRNMSKWEAYGIWQMLCQQRPLSLNGLQLLSFVLQACKHTVLLQLLQPVTQHKQDIMQRNNKLPPHQWQSDRGIWWCSYLVTLPKWFWLWCRFATFNGYMATPHWPVGSTSSPGFLISIL